MFNLACFLHFMQAPFSLPLSSFHCGYWPAKSKTDLLVLYPQPPSSKGHLDFTLPEHIGCTLDVLQHFTCTPSQFTFLDASPLPIFYILKYLEPTHHTSFPAKLTLQVTLTSPIHLRAIYMLIMLNLLFPVLQYV